MVAHSGPPLRFGRKHVRNVLCFIGCASNDAMGTKSPKIVAHNHIKDEVCVVLLVLMIWRRYKIGERRDQCERDQYMMSKRSGKTRKGRHHCGEHIKKTRSRRDSLAEWLRR